jgi:hypothetical protein
VVVANDTTVNCVTPAGVAGEAVDVSATTNEGTGTLPAGYYYLGPAEFTSITPDNGLAAGGTPITIVGRFFTGTYEMWFDWEKMINFTVVDDTTITAVTPPHSADVGDLFIYTPIAQSEFPDVFTFTNATLTNVVPSTVVNPAAGTLITLTGTLLTGATQVYVCGSLCGNLIVVDDTTVTCTIPNKPAMTGTVTIHTPQGRADWSGTFTYTDAPPPAPTVTAVTPNTGRYDTTTPVTVTGTNLTGASSVMFGSKAATGVTVDSATSLRCTVPTGSGAGAVRCDVTTPGGTAGLDNAFTYTAPPPPGPPQVLSLEPDHGPVQQQNPVRVHGKWFAGTSEVRFGMEGNATNIVVTEGVDGDDYLDCLTPASPGAGAEDVYVTTPLGFSEEYVLYTFDLP